MEEKWVLPAATQPGNAFRSISGDHSAHLHQQALGKSRKLYSLQRLSICDD